MFLRNRFMHTSLFRHFVGGALVLVLMAQPMLAELHFSKDQQRQYVQFMTRLIGQSTGEYKNASLASLAIGQLPCMQSQDTVFGSNEWKELQLDSLIKTIDRTKTSFGHHVFRQTLQPTRNVTLISTRKQQVQALLNDPALLHSIGEQLDRIKKAEESVLRYWDDVQQDSRGGLFNRANDYYKSPLVTLAGKQINDKKWPLEASVAWKIGMDLVLLLTFLGLDGVTQEFARWSSDSASGRSLDIWKAILVGLKTPWHCINPFKTNLGEHYDHSRAAWIYAQLSGSLGDAKHVLQEGVHDNAELRLGYLGYVPKGIAYGIPCLFRCLFGKCCGATDFLMSPLDNLNASIDKNGTFMMASTPESTRMSPLKAWAIAGGISFIKARFVMYRFQMAWRQIRQHIETTKELHVHTVHLARALDAMKNLAGMITGHEVLRNSCAAEHMHEVVGHPSSDLQKLFDLLQENTFTLPRAQSHVYSRGNVLLAHRLCEKVKDELVPLLQAVGELDAAYSMALFMKEHAGTDMPCSFVEFVPAAQATINLENAWLPMVKKPVANSIQLGGETHPNKIIITGPNGGGKSVFLKMIGCCVLLTQSWGIVPAQHAQLSFFDGVRSCIHPQESIEHELSTFMAEKMRIDAITQYVFENNKPGFKALLLLDEPFKGTVDAESADRIYAFGQKIAPLNGLIVGIATHVEKPIHLATDTGAYKNYHVCIQELPDGTFSRSFILEPGVLNWWFDDPAKRSRFIDFVTLEKHKEEQQAAAQA